MNGARTFAYKIKKSKIIKAVLSFSLSYIIPLLVQVVVFGLINKNKLNSLVVWGKIVEASGLLWVLTTVLIIVVYTYSSRCRNYENRKPNKVAIVPTLILIFIAIVIWLLGEFNTYSRDFEWYFIATLVLVIFSSCFIGMYKLMDINSKNKQNRGRANRDWLEE